MEVVENDSVFDFRTRAVETHLEVLVVRLDLVERELAVRKKRDILRLIPGVFQGHVPEEDVLAQGNRHLLHGMNIPVVALIDGVGKAVASLVASRSEGLPHRLPGDGPEVPVAIVSEVGIEARGIHGHPVAPKLRNPVVLRRAAEEVAPGRMVYDRAHSLHAQVVGPRSRQVHPVHHIFPLFIVEMSVLHVFSLNDCLKPAPCAAGHFRAARSAAQDTTFIARRV